MRDVIEKFDLDVTKPPTLNSIKKAKTTSIPQFETMLHAAAASCDVALVDWLISRGAPVNYCLNCDPYPPMCI